MRMDEGERFPARNAKVGFIQQQWDLADGTKRRVNETQKSLAVARQFGPKTEHGEVL